MKRITKRLIIDTLLVAMLTAFCATSIAEPQNIVLEPTLQAIQSPTQLPSLTATVYLPTVEQATAMFGLDGGVKEDHAASLRVSIGEDVLNYFPHESIYYRRMIISDMVELLSFDLPYPGMFDGAWLSDGAREAAFMSRGDAHKLVTDMLSQFGLSGWETDIKLYYIDMDDWRRQIENTREYMAKSIDIDNCKNVYYAIIRLGHEGVVLDNSDYELLNHRTVVANSIAMLIDEDGLLHANIRFCYGIEDISEPKPLIGYNEAVDILDDYYGDLYMSHQINVSTVEFVYCPYPISQTEYEMVPTWKFGIRGFASGADYIREYVRIDATTGRILE